MSTPLAEVLIEDESSSIITLPTEVKEWPIPQPLSAKVRPEPYPIDVLPVSIRAAVEEVHRFVQAPIPLVASSALAAISVAVQAHVDVQRAKKLSGPSSLFLLSIADSGERKSTCDGFFTKAIRDYEIEQAEAAKPPIKNYLAALDSWESKRAGIKDKIRQLAKGSKSTATMESALGDLENEKPMPPRVPRLTYADATPEALTHALAKEWSSGGVMSAEAGIVFGSHGMNKESVMRNLATLNQLWDGGPLTIDRRTTDSFIVSGARLTVALQVQDATLRDFLARAGPLARGSGFLARFLLAWPETTQGFRPFTEAPPHWPHMAAFNRRIAEILERLPDMDANGALVPRVLTLTADAKAAWIVHHDDVENELRSGGDLYDIRDVASKSADNVARLAALFQVFDSTNSTNSSSNIEVRYVEAASQLALWHLNESRRFFGELALPSELTDAARLDDWLLRHCKPNRTDVVPKNFIRQYGPLRDAPRLNAAIRELEDMARVRLKDVKPVMLEINPALVEK